MQKWDRKKVKMFEQIMLFFSKRAALFSSYTTLLNAVTELVSTVDDIRIADSVTGYRGAYSTEQKGIFKKALIDVLLGYNASLGVWFHVNNDENAPMETRITTSGIKYAATDRLLVIARKTYDYVQANLAALGAYGFDAARQTLLQQAQDDFAGMSDMPRREADNRKDNNKKLADLIAKANKLVREDISIHMKVYSTTDPMLYLRFLIAARLGKPGTRVMALRVIVQNEALQPLQGCKIVVQSARKDAKAIEKITKKSGILPYQNLPRGRCSITATLPDGSTQTQEVTIKASARQEVVFVG